MLILASQSRSKRELLEDAGVEFKAISPSVDEDSLKKQLFVDSIPAKDAAIELASAKAKDVSEKNPDAFVIGADQLLELNGEWFSKPENISMAHKHLKKLRNKEHKLYTGAVIMKSGKILWKNTSIVSVVMRDYTDNFIDEYIANAGDDICESVGAYYIEDLGAQLIKSVDGDFFSILGLPLLPLLECLRSIGELKR
ncbi:MAG: Maf family protein [Alphaproteobacteria bacterium]|nr:Maf family protein [Alphaproteobacteria bacterium]